MEQVEIESLLGRRPPADKFPHVGGFDAENIVKMMEIATHGIILEINNDELRRAVLRNIDTLLSFYATKAKDVVTLASCDEVNNSHVQIDNNEFVLDVHYFRIGVDEKFRRIRMRIDSNGSYIDHE